MSHVRLRGSIWPFMTDTMFSFGHRYYIKSVRVHLVPGSKAVKTVYTSSSHNANICAICGRRTRLALREPSAYYARTIAYSPSQIRCVLSLWTIKLTS